MNPSSVHAAPPHNIAACYQEMFSLAAQLSVGREIGAPDRFSTDVKALLRQGDAAAKALGYPDEDINMARFAVVALLDDVILNSTAGTFLSWANNPLVIQLFQKGGAGVRFFNYLNDLLQKPEAPRTLDVLEVYLLCLLLGFRGQYGRTHDEQLYLWREPVIEKLQRVLNRGRTVAMAVDWRPVAEVRLLPLPRHRTRRALSIALGVGGLLPILFVAYALILARGTAGLGQLVGR
jgi:type VI secretion system protein ImpK